MKLLNIKVLSPDLQYQLWIKMNITLIASSNLYIAERRNLLVAMLIWWSPQTFANIC